MKNRRICDLSVEIRLEPNGFLGDRWEYDPYISSFATFSSYRVPKVDYLKKEAPGKALNHSSCKSTMMGMNVTMGDKVAEKALLEEKEITLITVNNRTRECYSSTEKRYFELDDYSEMRGDEAIKFKLFSHTNYAGVPFLDKAESEHVIRDRISGMFHLELYDLFKFYLGRKNKDNHTIEVFDEFINEKIVQEKVKSLANTDNITSEVYLRYRPMACQLTKKADAVVSITFHNFNQNHYRKSIFSHDHLKHTSLHAYLPNYNALLSQHYNASSVSIHSDLVKHKTRGFQPILYNSSKSYAMMADAMNDVLEEYCNNFIQLDENHKPLYKPCDEKTGNLHFPMFISDAGRTRVDQYWRESSPAFRPYANEAARDRDLQLYAYNEDTEHYFKQLLHSSLVKHGLSKESFISAINEHFSPKNTSTIINPAFIEAEKAVAFVGTMCAVSSDYTADYIIVNESNTVRANMSKTQLCSMCGRAVQNDSWDSNILNNTSKCDDCEGQGKTATSIVREYSVGRYELKFSWQSEELRAVQKLLYHSSICDLGTLVTSAFMNTDNTKLETNEKTELPMRGSDMDKNAEHGGHAFGMMTSLSMATDLLEKGGTCSDIISEMRRQNTINSSYVEREKYRYPLIMEGTGSIEPYILPQKETYKSSAQLEKNHSVKIIIDHLRSVVKSDKEKYANISTLFSGEGMPYSYEKCDPEQLVSFFYYSAVHGTSADMTQRFGEPLSQFTFCKEMNNEYRYGVHMGDILRPERHSDLALICPLAKSCDRLDQKISPTMESITNQTEIMAFGRYTKEDYSEKILFSFVSPEEVNDSFRFENVDAHYKINEKRRSEFESKCFAVENGNTTITRLYTAPWKMDLNVNHRKELMKFIESHVLGLEDYAFYVERFIPVCDKKITIVCLSNVKKVLGSV